MVPATLVCLLPLALLASATLTVGLNCTVEDCEERPACPPDSEPGQDGQCVCRKSGCGDPPFCQSPSKLTLTHKASRKPADCCDVHECVFPQELNCSKVVCPGTEKTCPADSYRLPNSQAEGECCSRPLGCACLPGPCVPPPCPAGQQPVVHRPGNAKPGTCCPLYQCQPHISANVTCSIDGKEIITGTKWKKTECIECYCSNGMIHCSPTVVCPDLPPDCPATRLPQGQCCPHCVFNHNEVSEVVRPGGCKTSKGVIHKNEATWKEDDCTHCKCVDGVPKCQAEMCHQACANATIVVGECCPKCNGESSVPDVLVNCTTPANCSLTCKHGFVKDNLGCSICKCEEKEECHLKCESGFLKDGSGTELCECAKECPSLMDCSKKCKHGYKTNKAGCEICKCEHCKPMSHCSKTCPHGLQSNQKGCPICKCKAPVLNNTTEVDCITESGIKRDNGEAWSDNCRECYCFEGKEMCSLVSCPRVDCPDPVFSKNACCPICPGKEDVTKGTEVLCYGPGGVRHEMESWKQACLDCVCHNGTVLCHSDPCPPVLCQHPLQGDCCPVCPQESVTPIPKSEPEHNCGDRKPGEKWRQSECTSCICNNGEAVCYTQSCDQMDTSCKTPVQLKNQCCPICFDNLADEKICQVGNVTFNIGDEWEPEKCTRCSCGPAHTISCTQTICERPCSKIDNPCCPKCIEVDGGHDWLRGPVYMVIVSMFMFALGAGSVLLWKKCQLKRHQLKICQPTAPSYHYKYVRTYDHPATPSPHKSPV